MCIRAPSSPLSLLTPMILDRLPPTGRRNGTLLPRAPLLAAAMLGLAACSPDAPPAITVGPVQFTEDALLGLSADRRLTLTHLVAFGLSVADSSTAELGTPLVRSWADDRRLEILGADLLLEANGVGDDVLEAQYLTNPEWELVVRHILFFSERWRSAAHRAEAEAKAGRALEALRGGADFATTAAALSEEPGAEGRQGLLTPGRRGSWVPEFWEAAVTLEPGGMSAVTETQYGFHILRLEGRQVVPFTESRTVVARRVANQVGDPETALRDWMAEAGSTADVARTAALEEAERRALRVPDGERAELERQWDDLTYRWAAALGFRYGMSAPEVGAAALTALSNPGQGVNLVRREIDGHGAMVAAPYTVQMAGSPAS